MAKRKIPETITHKEFKKIILKTKNNKNKLAYSLGFYQGMRVSEVVKLTSDNIDCAIRIIMMKEAKGSKDRNLPIAPQVLNQIQHLPLGVGVRALQYSFKKAAKKALDKDLHFHCLRQSYKQKNNHLPQKTLKQLLGLSPKSNL